MKRLIQLLLCIACFLSLAACQTARRHVRENLLTSDLPQSAFLSEWGNPDKTYMISTDHEGTSVQAGTGWGGASFRMQKGGKTAYEVWEYTERKVKLVFNHRKRLVEWSQ